MVLTQHHSTDVMALGLSWAFPTSHPRVSVSQITHLFRGIAQTLNAVRRDPHASEAHITQVWGFGEAIRPSSTEAST